MSSYANIIGPRLAEAFTGQKDISNETVISYLRIAPTERNLAPNSEVMEQHNKLRFAVDKLHVMKGETAKQAAAQFKEELTVYTPQIQDISMRRDALKEKFAKKDLPVIKGNLQHLAAQSKDRSSSQDVKNIFATNQKIFDEYNSQANGLKGKESRIINGLKFSNTKAFVHLPSEQIRAIEKEAVEAVTSATPRREN